MKIEMSERTVLMTGCFSRRSLDLFASCLIAGSEGVLLVCGAAEADISTVADWVSLVAVGSEDMVVITKVREA